MAEALSFTTSARLFRMRSSGPPVRKSFACTATERETGAPGAKCQSHTSRLHEIVALIDGNRH
jgi:hypothetical protein